MKNAGAAGVTNSRDMLTLSSPEPQLWERFEADTLTQHDLDRHVVLARWARVRSLRRRLRFASLPRIATDELSLRAQQEHATALVAQANDELEAAFRELHRRGFSLVLADHDGIILMSRGGVLLDRVGMHQGVSMSEADFGTNAVGTALAEERPVAVLGAAHYEREAKGICCYAAPIRDTSGRAVAVLDFTGPAQAADPLVGTVVLSLASAMESALRLRQITNVAVAAPQYEPSELFANGQLHLGMVSHDLRNPISALRIGADLLARYGDPFVSRVAARMLSSASRMDRMVGDLLEFTRESAGTVALDRRPANLYDLCREVLDELRLLHPDRTLTLHCAGDARGLWDGARLMRVIENLVGNAIAHGRPGTPVAVTTFTDADVLTLEVTNEGPPIPAALRRHLFDPFRRGNTTGGNGLGLGLYIAKSIVLAHGGTITLDSDESLTRFRVRLPRDRS